uniref:Receptor ligand binding region domain-containing protein n=1 Tax=Plectus sambesii TaxID=2011161 RepID=A0A914VK51_9BILA
MVLNEKTIFEMAKAHLIESKLLDDQLQFELVSVQGCGDFNGVAYASKMYYLQNVKAFVGPSCSDEMTAVAKLATIWNIPLIGYVSSDGYLDNKLIYRTLARISMSASNGITDAVVALLRHFGWQRVSIATSESTVAAKIISEFEAKFAVNNIEIIAKVVFPENMTAEEYIASDKLRKIRETSRIVIVLFGSSLSDCVDFMRAIHLEGMDNDEYMYLLPWLYHDVTSRAPWWTPNGTIIPSIKSDFNRAIVIDNEGILDIANNNFMARVLNETTLNTSNLTQTSIHSYLEMFDALKLYVIAVRKAINESGQQDIYLDGRYIWNKMRSVRFDGVSGPVIMDDQAERVPLYAVFFVDPEQAELTKIISIEPRRMPNCDGLINNTGCFEMFLTDVGDGVWPFKDGKLPSDTPECGFLGEKCDHKVQIAVGVAIIIIILTVVAILIRFQY